MSGGFRLVALLSTYQEGPLARGAIESCLEANLDDVIVWDGPAGDDVTDAPETDPSEQLVRTPKYHTDAQKRDAMLQHVKRELHDLPLWVVWVDGDELLVNGRYLRDHIQAVMWEDEQRGASIVNDQEPPTGGIPIRVVDHDGSVVADRGRVIRADLVSEILVSNLIYRLINNTEIRLGRVPVTLDDLPQARALDELGKIIDRTPSGLERDAMLEHYEQIRSTLLLPPPLPGEPYLIHRPHLRHPARRTLRLHEQEAAELDRLQLPR